MEEREIRLRCIEAAAKAPIVHQDGPAAGVLETAQRWAAWAMHGDQPAGQVAAGTLSLPKKGR